MARRDAVGPESASAEVWDANATWWKETFTDGADQEYEVEILPLVASELSGCRRIVDIGCGKGRSLAVWPTVTPRSSASIHRVRS